MLFDKERGAEYPLYTDGTDASMLNPDTLTAFNADGYALGDALNPNKLNSNFLDLALKSGVDQGLEIVTATGDDAYKLIPHNLGKTPTVIIGKCLDTPPQYPDWRVWHRDLPSTGSLILNNTGATYLDNGVWGEQQNTISATHFPVGQYMNQAGIRYVFYVFTDSDIFKAFSYTGNGNADGPFVNLGGKVLSIPFVKDSGRIVQWQCLDAARDTFNPIHSTLYPSDTAVENTANNFYNFTAQGFKSIEAANGLNVSGNLIVGLAILESTKYSNAY